MVDSGSRSVRRRALRSLQAGDHAAAVAAWRQVLSQDPGHPDDWYNLAYSLRHLGQFEAALQAYGEALDLGAAGAEEIHLNRAVILSDHLGRPDDAERELRTAVHGAPGYAPAWLNLGNLHEEAGRREQATECYRCLLALPGVDNNLAADAWARLAHLDPAQRADDPRLGQLERASRLPEIDPDTRANVLLALARTRDRLGQCKAAFAEMSTAKRLIRQRGRRYDRVGHEHLIDALMNAFPGDGERCGSVVPERPRLVFVCGMFRSGSTLIEQILAAHPQVHAGGELDILPRLVARDLRPFPKALAGMGEGDLANLARNYFAEACRVIPELAEIDVLTDKRPDNFLFIGLILRLFPQARIVHTTRHLLDTAVSIFMHHLDPRVAPYANDLEDIGHYMIQYRRLMAHWRRCHPERIFDCSYEQMVSEPQASLRDLLEFLDLPFEPRCLQFHRLSKPVKTASYWQVRRPLYPDACGRWRRYEPFLTELRRTLADAGVDPDA